MMNNRLMILGTNEYQNPLILRAKELGYETHVFGLPRGEIGEKTADFFYPVDILDYVRLWEECERLNPCGVASICSELAMHPMNYLLRRMEIPCNSVETEILTTNKYLMRKAMQDGGVDSPNFMLVRMGQSVEEVETIAKDFVYPLIIKPCDLSSSRGVFKIETPAQLEEGMAYALGWTKTGEAVLEEFIEGPEYSGESIAYEGNYKLLAITEKSTTGAPHFVETGHRQPARLSPMMAAKVEETLYKAFRALDIRYGAIHPEFRITPDGRILFMEIATRMGGDCIGTDLVPLSSGYDFIGMVIDICCGHAPGMRKIHSPRIACNHYIITPEDLTRFNELKKLAPQQIWRHSDIGPISENPILKSADRAGYYITVE